MDAEAIASLTTAGGTLVLAIATFASTRSANRASRVAERSLLAGLRPVLIAARLDDPQQKVGFVDGHWVHLEGPGAIVDATDDAVYLAVACRNVGTGIAVLQSWYPQLGRVTTTEHAPIDEFRPLSRDIYVPAGDLGFWQGAFRDRDDPLYAGFEAAARDREIVTIDVLYTDVHGGQRTISRFTLQPARDDRWMSVVGRHWMLDGVSPR